MPDGETLYDPIVGRISAVHRGGRMDTSRNLIRYITVDSDGPKLPGVSVRVFRRKLRQMGLFFAKTKKVLAAERSNQYISRWGGYLLKKKSCDDGGWVAIAAARVDGRDICKQMVNGEQKLDHTGHIIR